MGAWINEDVFMKFNNDLILFVLRFMFERALVVIFFFFEIYRNVEKIRVNLTKIKNIESFIYRGSI